MIVLRHYAGLSEAEVADALEVAPGTVRSRLFRAMRLMRAAIDAADHTPDARPQEAGR